MNEGVQFNPTFHIQNSVSFLISTYTHLHSKGFKYISNNNMSAKTMLRYTSGVNCAKPQLKVRREAPPSHATTATVVPCGSSSKTTDGCGKPNETADAPQNGSE